MASMRERVSAKQKPDHGLLAHDVECKIQRGSAIYANVRKVGMKPCGRASASPHKKSMLQQPFFQRLRGHFKTCSVMRTCVVPAGRQPTDLTCSRRPRNTLRSYPLRAC